MTGLQSTAMVEFFTRSYGHQLLLFLLLVLACGSVSFYLGQDINWDLLNYHYYNGYAVIHHRILWDVAPALMQTYLNPIFDVLNYGLVSLKNPKVTVFLLSLNSAIIGFFLYKISVCVFSDLPSRDQTVLALASVLLGMTGVASISLLGTTTNDLNSSVIIVISLYLLLKFLLSHGKSLWYVGASGLLIGFGVGCKLTSACYLIGLFAGFVYCTRGEKKQYVLLSIFILFSIIGFLLSNGYWMSFLYQHFQNPFFPYYNNIFHSDFAPFMSFNLPPAEVKATWLQLLLMPLDVAIKMNATFSETPLRDPRFLTVMILGALYFIQKARNAMPEMNDSMRFVGAFFAVSYVAWLILFAVYRYALPLELLTGLLITYFMRGLFPSRKWGVFFLLLLGLFFAMTTSYPTWGRMKIGGQYFSMTVPKVQQHATIVIAAVPLSYVIPFFPEDARFIGMTFVSLGESLEQGGSSQSHKKLLTKVMAELKQNPTHSPLYSLTIQKSGIAGYLTIAQTARNNKRTFAILNNFGFVRDEKNCVMFDTNVGDTLKLCPLIFKKEKGQLA